MNPADVRLHVFGASGTGTTTLGRAFAEQHGARHFDADDYFWEQSDPPYQHIRPRAERQHRLLRDLDETSEGWVLSGSIVGWGDIFIPRFHLAIFLTLEPDVRLLRLLQREQARYGATRLMPGGDMHPGHTAFIEWAQRYDTAGTEQRSRALHEQWSAQLPCRLLRLDARAPVDALVETVNGEVARLGQTSR